MKVSYNWLKQYINLDIDPEQLSEVLTNIGLEVEGISSFQSLKGGLKGVVVGEVKTCVKHPNADKLSVTTVDIGSGLPLPIVCGAPNVTAGQKVLVATVGTTLYSGDSYFQINKSKIRGEVSEGMICAEDELGIGTSHEGIMVLPADVASGTRAADYFNIEEDVVFEIGLTPNRADATSHIGTARDLLAGLNRLKGQSAYTLELPSVEAFRVDNQDLNIEVVVEDQLACPRYTGVTLSGIQVKESPGWLKNRLNAIGLRPINNIVDATNYVLHETGQPLHAFNADAIKGGKVVVRKEAQDTLFVTLDEVSRKLHQEDLMICHAEEGMCIAGVFGGTTSGVTDETTNIFLESAYFDPTHIRKTSKRHGLQTDASFRFERGADPNITEYALKRAILLMQELAGGKVSSEIKDVYTVPITPWQVVLRYQKVDRLIGKVIDRTIIKDILRDLEIEIAEESEGQLLLRVPTYKVDVKREVDIIEEILRIYGYNNIEFENKVNASVSVRSKPDLEQLQNGVADYLVAHGYSETMNNSLSASAYTADSSIFPTEQNVQLLNPLSQDLDVLRQSLLFGGLEVTAYNLNRKINRIRIFEFGKAYQFKKSEEKAGLKNYVEEKQLALFASGDREMDSWNQTEARVDFYELKGMAEGVLRKLGINMDRIVLKEAEHHGFSYGLQYYLDQVLIVELGKVSDKLQKAFDINREVFAAFLYWERLIKKQPKSNLQYQAVSKYPAVRRDLSFLVDEAVSFGALKEVARKSERKLLKSVGIFDIYQGDKIPEGKKSYALSFILEDREKTLTDKEIDKTMKKIQASLERDFAIELR